MAGEPFDQREAWIWYDGELVRGPDARRKHVWILRSITTSRTTWGCIADRNAGYWKTF